MAKRLIALAVLVLVAGFVSQEATRVGPSNAVTSGSAASRLSRVALSGVAIVLSPIGSMAGCGGGGPKTSSATAVALSETVLNVGSAEAPVVAAGGGAGALSHLAVADRRPVSGLEVSVRLSGEAAGEVSLSLRHPDGAEVQLYDGPAALVASFDAQSRPELRSLLSRSADGVWTLAVSARGGDATLESWNLRLQVQD
ncbi:MAG TPA: proprotein convertase P-domain-containing protein [Vicinamibacteria bacterium]|nr:proprotein convertase P-domain-containing protein [Vicinamibacteria bacterium]